MITLQLLSIAMEAIVAGLGLLMAQDKKKHYGYFIALTFGIYFFYDIVTFFNVEVPTMTLRWFFFAASASILYAAWYLYKSKK